MLIGDLEFYEEGSAFDDDEKEKWLADHHAEYKKLRVQERPTLNSAQNRCDHQGRH